MLIYENQLSPSPFDSKSYANTAEAERSYHKDEN